MSEEHVDGGAVQQIERITREAVRVETIEIGGVTYSARPLHDVRRSEPVPSTLVFSTLAALVAFAIAQDTDYMAGRGCFLHVVDVDRVDLCTGIFGPFHQRVTVASAQMKGVKSFGFEKWYPPDLAAIELRALFEQTADRDTIIAIAGNVTEEAAKTSTDDGLSQTVTARTGVASVSKLPVPMPAELKPFRSFPEIKPVPSPFLVRLRGGGPGALPQVALFECDGGRWRLETLASIREWLIDALEESPIRVYG